MNGCSIDTISLILLPGLDGTGILFEPLLAQLPQSIRPIVVAYPGDRHLTYSELIPLVRQALPTSGRYILLGESFSGPLAVMLAAARPAGLAGLILCASFVTNPRPVLATLLGCCVRPSLFALFPMLQKLKTRIGGYSSSELSALFSRVHARVRPNVMASLLGMVFEVDVRQSLRQCSSPILYIAGAKDRVVPARNRRLIQGICPQMHCETIDAPHLILQTRPKEAAETIARFASALQENQRGIEPARELLSEKSGLFVSDHEGRTTRPKRSC